MRGPTAPQHLWHRRLLAKLDTNALGEWNFQHREIIKQEEKNAKHVHRIRLLKLVLWSRGFSIQSSGTSFVHSAERLKSRARSDLGRRHRNNNGQAKAIIFGLNLSIPTCLTRHGLSSKFQSSVSNPLFVSVISGQKHTESQELLSQPPPKWLAKDTRGSQLKGRGPGRTHLS